jgi:hypothetical protein
MTFVGLVIRAVGLALLLFSALHMAKAVLG